jgi:hypothetical protein
MLSVAAVFYSVFDSSKALRTEFGKWDFKITCSSFSIYGYSIGNKCDLRGLIEMCFLHILGSLFYVCK